MSWSFCPRKLSEAIEHCAFFFWDKNQFGSERSIRSGIWMDESDEKNTFLWVKCLLTHAFTALIQLHFQADLHYEKLTVQRTRESSFKFRFLYLQSYYHQFTDVLGTRSSWFFPCVWNTMLELFRALSYLDADRKYRGWSVAVPNGAAVSEWKFNHSFL